MKSLEFEGETYLIVPELGDNSCLGCILKSTDCLRMPIACDDNDVIAILKADLPAYLASRLTKSTTKET